MEETRGQRYYRKREVVTGALNLCHRCRKKEREKGNLCWECSTLLKEKGRLSNMERKMMKVCVKCGDEDERTFNGKSRCLKCAIRESMRRKERLEKQGITIENRLKY